MTRLAFIADVHAANHRRHGGASERSLNARCRAVLATLRAAYGVAEQAGATSLVVLGDLFDDDTPEPQLVGEVLAILKASPLATILLVGNHDQTSDEPGDHALAALATEACVIDTPRIVTVGTTELVFVPHGAAAPAVERISGALASLPRRSPRATARLLAVHAGIADEKTAPFLQGSTGAITAAMVQQLAKAHGVDHAFAGDWHDRRDWPDVLQVGALCPTGWDNPGFDGYGGVAIYDTDAPPGSRLLVHTVPGPRFIRTDGAAELRELLDHPRLASPCAVYVSAHVPHDEIANASRLLGAVKQRGTVAAFEVVASGADEARAQAHKAAGAARSATTLDEALAKFVEHTPLDLPDGVTPAQVLARCQEYLR